MIEIKISSDESGEGKTVAMQLIVGILNSAGFAAYALEDSSDMTTKKAHIKAATEIFSNSPRKVLVYVDNEHNAFLNEYIQNELKYSKK